MLHGCLQTADDAARGTRLDEWADREGFVVLYPEQSLAAHVKRCWNWYVPSDIQRDSGEAGLLAALVDSVAAAHGIPQARIALMGMSAGAAMAATLAMVYPDRYGALVMHSGVPAGVAHDVTSAVALMRTGGSSARSVEGPAPAASRSPPLPVLLIHGLDDAVVAPANLDAVARQWTALTAGADGARALAPVEPASPRLPPVAGHLLTGRRSASIDGKVGVEWWTVGALGHAWSGGSPTGSFTDPSGPDATALAVSFLSEAWGRSHAAH